MICLCGGKLMVIDTLTEETVVRRMRECADCGKLYGPTDEHRVSAVTGVDPRPWAKLRLKNSQKRSVGSRQHK